VKPDSIFKPGLKKDHEFEEKKSVTKVNEPPMTAPVDPKWNWWSFCP
jgi:hypothetical protein